MISVDPTTDAVEEIRKIDNPVDRAWTAEALHRSSLDRAKAATDGPTRRHLNSVASEALMVRSEAIDTLLAGYADLKPFTGLRDHGKKAWLAEQIRRVGKDRAKTVRDLRDRAALVMIQPFVEAVYPTNKARSEAMALYEAGEMSTKDYNDVLNRLLAERHKALADANVAFEPADVYKPLGISRARFIQMIDEMAGVKLPRMRNAPQVMEEAAREVDRLVEIQEACRAVRNASIEVLLRKHSNAVVARLIGLTTARIAQLRKGTR
jgi:hypothetical protein